MTEKQMEEISLQIATRLKQMGASKPTAITILRMMAMDWGLAQQLVQWLQENPEATLEQTMPVVKAIVTQ